MRIDIVFLSVALLFAGLFFAYRRWKSNYYRRYGKRVEKAAIARVRLPKNWVMVPNKPIPGLGDADIFICTPKGKRWNVEIKSYESAKKVSAFSFTKSEIVKNSGHKFDRDPIAQVLNVAKRLDSNPVLWLPKAPDKRTFKTTSGVLVVQGGARKLERAIGARSLFW